MISPAFRSVLEECAAARGAHVIDLVVRGEGSSSLVEVFVDAEGPVTSDLCAQLSRDVADGIELNNLVRGSYRLVVSSPGTDRPLKYYWQYRKHVGRPLEIRVQEGEGTRVVVGRLLESNETGVVIENDRTRSPMPLDFRNIIEAKVKTPW